MMDDTRYSDNGSLLAAKKCIPCSVDMPPMEKSMVDKYLKDIKGWDTIDHKKIHKRFRLPGFMDAVSFMDDIAQVSEDQGHHPNLCIYYDEVDVTLWTHKIGGLHENDFIMAAKIDNLADKHDGNVSLDRLLSGPGKVEETG